MDLYFLIHYFRLCRIKVDKKPLNYCKNKALNFAIKQIGIYKAPNGHKSAYQRGIDYVCASYRVMYNETLYKTELRRLVRPNRKREHCLYFPKKTLKILECITSCIDMPANGTIHMVCMEARNTFCTEVRRPTLCCYYYLVYELIRHLRALEGRMEHRSLVYDIFRKIENHPQKCKK